VAESLKAAEGPKTAGPRKVAEGPKVAGSPKAAEAAERKVGEIV